MVMLALVAFASHARLAADRPETSQLTTFYLVVAIGGALGGLLNGVVAPLLFDRVLEYALLIVVVPLLLLGLRVNRDEIPDEARRRRRVRLLGVAVGLLVLVAAIAVVARDSRGLLLALLVAGLLAWPLTRSPRVLCVVLVVLQVLLLVASNVDIIDRRRTFYGSYSTKATSEEHILYDGTTLHGTQFLDARSADPTSYYTRSGPLGDVFGLRRFQDVAIVGLGAGTMAAYGEPGQSMTFDEIDQADVDIASDPHLFTYLADSKADIRVVVGDGRIGLAAAPKASYDLIVLDAFSSDSIPVHLLTREAAAMYAERLRPGGLLVFHITNHTFDLRPVMRGLADSLGWVGIVGDRESHDPGASPSTWVVLAPTTQDLDAIAHREGWTPLPARSVGWTDDYSSVLRVLR
jgi:spermidine synthase